MNFAEHAFTFECRGKRLLGVLAQPEQPRSTAVLVIVGGPQYRVGSHRQFLYLAHHLAAEGFPVLRFDARGMGDSEGDPRSFEAVDEDIAAAADALLSRVAAGTRLVLWGLCDGASAALLYLDRQADPRVRAVALVNPWVRSDVTLALTHVKHYYRERVMQRSFWSKLLRGGVSGDAVRDFWQSLRRIASAPRSSPPEDLTFQARMARAWLGFDGQILLLLSGSDLTGQEFAEAVTHDPAWAGALDRPGVSRHDVDKADHTFSRPDHQRTLEALTLGWLDGLAQSRPASPA